VSIQSPIIQQRNLTLFSPYIFLTNGGGKTEAERCVDLSRQLDIEVSPAQFICGMYDLYVLSQLQH
jgi:ribonucleotide monophosphatase NagD (HAD superfamily)